MALQDKTEDWLLPYLEGAYLGDAARLAEIEARLAADPALAAEAAQMRQTLNAVRGAAARTPRPETAAVPADSWPRLKARIQPAPSRRLLSWGWLGGAGAAVAVAAGVLAVVLPGHHTPPPKAVSPPRVVAASRPATATGPAAKTVQAPPLVAQTAPAQPLAGPLSLPNTSGLSDPFLKLPTPPAHAGGTAEKTTPPVVIKPMPQSVPKPNQRVARRDITSDRLSPEVVSPLLPLPVPPSTAPAPAAPPLPAPATDTAAPRALFERRMLKAAPPASASSQAAGGQAQAFSTEAAPGAPSSTANTLNQATPPAAAFGGGGGFAGGTGEARGRSMKRMAVPPAASPLSADSTARLATAQTALTEAVAPPLWGKNAGMQQVNETLTGVQEAGLLDDLRTRLEARRGQMPNDLATGRMLAAVYDFSGSADTALGERRRVAALSGADGEDFFQLAQDEERAANTDAARLAYRRALTVPIPPSGFHAAIARQKAQ